MVRGRFVFVDTTAPGEGAVLLEDRALMIALANACCFALSVEEIQARFLSMLPRIETHARIYFRHVKCADRKQDCTNEVVALAWKWHCRLAEKGKDAREFVTTLAALAARHVGSGRRLCGQERSRDVLSPLAQRRHGFEVEELPASVSTCHEELYAKPYGQNRQDVWEERLRDNRFTPPDQQAAFRIDFAAWLRTLTARERRLVRAMIRSERTTDLSKRFNVSPGRISQLRRDFERGWKSFCGELLDDVSNNSSHCA